MRRSIALIAVVLLAGAGVYLLHRSGDGDADRPASPTASLATTTLGEPREHSGDAPRASMPGSIDGAAPRPPDVAASAPLAFEYAAEQQASDGSFAVRWNFAETARLRRGDRLRVRLPFAAEPYTAIVVEDTAQEGTRRLAGRLQDDQGIDSWPFSVTTSTDGRFVTANFTTGAAQFALEANAEGGRLRDTSSDEARLAHDEMH